MASECVLKLETEQPISMKCATDAGIEKGAILMMTSPLTAALATGDGDIIAGICANEVLAANSGFVSVYRRGIFEGLAGGAITVNEALRTFAATGATNEIDTATASEVGGKTLGIALETKADGNRFLFELNVGCNNQAYA